MRETTIDEWDGQPLWAFQPDDVITRDFRAVELLGVGKRCESWLSECPRRGPVVLKICRPHQVEHPRGRRAMHREADALARLQNPTIRSLLENCMDDPFPALVLAYAPGLSLSELVDDDTLSVPEALAMVASLVPAIAEIHRAGLVHLDLKPTNVIIDDDPYHPLLIDLGSCRPIGFDPGEGTPLGSPGYAPPELELNMPVTEAMDVFGLGTILYEALTGETAFDPDLPATERPQTLAPSQSSVSCSPMVDDLVCAMLATDPALRPGLGYLNEMLNQTRAELREQVVVHP